MDTMLLLMMPSSFLKHLISVACKFFWMSVVIVQVSQAYNSLEIIRECISLIFELREIIMHNHSRWSSVLLMLLSSVQFS